MAYEVRGSEGELLISGSSTQVLYDYEAGRPKALEDDARGAITRQDGPFAPGGRPAEEGG
jgi:acyl-CoA thioesterase FadM